jgi:hypothetical protein
LYVLSFDFLAEKIPEFHERNQRSGA